MKTAFRNFFLLAATGTASVSLAQSVTPGAPIATMPATTSATQPIQQGPRSILLKSGERVTGTVTGGTMDTIVIQSDALGSMTIKKVLIAEVIGPDGKPESDLDTLAVTPQDSGLFGTGLFAGWTRQMEAGITGTSGTTNSTAGDVQLNLSVDNPSYRSTLGAFWFFSRTEGTTDRNQTRVFGTYDKRIDNGPWFVFGKGQYDNDSLEDYENRVSVFAGPGYEFIRNEKYELLGRIGAGYTTEFGGVYPDGYDRSRIEALVGLDGKWVIDASQQLVSSLYYYPSFDDIGYGRVVGTAAYQVDLNQSKGLAFKSGVEYQYDLHPAGSDARNNLKYFANIVLKL